MAEDEKDPPVTDPPVDDDDKVDPDNDPNDPDNDPDQGKPKDPPKDPELEKAIKRRDAALAGRKKAEEEAAALREKYEKDKTDPVKVANGRLVKAEARTVLTAAGITDKAEQATVMRYLDLDSVSVGTDGDVDSADLEGRVEELRDIFGKKTPATKKTGPRTDTRDRGGDKGKPADAASARRRAMLGY
jgi:hypothetical protein